MPLLKPIKHDRKVTCQLMWAHFCQTYLERVPSKIREMITLKCQTFQQKLPLWGQRRTTKQKRWRSRAWTWHPLRTISSPTWTIWWQTWNKRSCHAWTKLSRWFQECTWMVRHEGWIHSWPQWRFQFHYLVHLTPTSIVSARLYREIVSISKRSLEMLVEFYDLFSKYFQSFPLVALFWLLVLTHLPKYSFYLTLDA